MSGSSRYTLGSSAAERTRLARQAAKIGPATERLFRAAGIGEGARVLDVGCGAGDVTMVAASLVGASGSVVGIDRDEAQLEAAATRCADAGLANTRFTVADLRDPPPGPFDAVVGRLVLMYQPDPAAALRALASRLVPGGVMAFLEMCNPVGDHGPGGPSYWPPTDVHRRVRSWIFGAFRATGVHPMMGLRLPAAFRAAGLEPQDPLEATSIVYTGREAADMMSALVRSMLRVIVERGIATEAEVDIDTLADRFEAATDDEELVIAIGPIAAVWARAR